MNGLVTIVGRPNVGKSTLFNALTHSKNSIVSPVPGVTRDRLYGKIPYEDGQGLILIDTGGFEKIARHQQATTQNTPNWGARIWEQTKLAIIESDLVLFILDAKTGVHPHDFEILQFLREKEKKVHYVINKVDSPKDEYGLWEFTRLGIQNFTHICAAHNRGLGDLKETIRQDMEGLTQASRIVQDGCKLALIGRPNVGKSSILNRILGEERSIVSPVSGTTRDSIHTNMNYKGEPYVLIDTAGIRRKTNIDEFIEEQSVIRSLSAIQKADIVLLVIDAIEGLTDQDAKLINLAVEKSKTVLIIVNKWDLVPDKTANTMRDYQTNIINRLGDLAYLPVHFVSCLENYRVHKIMERIVELREQLNKRIDKVELNLALTKIIETHPPHLKGNNIPFPEFHDALQAYGVPPTLIVRCNCARAVISSYRRYMVHGFRRELGFTNVPLRLVLKGRRREVSELA